MNTSNTRYDSPTALVLGIDTGGTYTDGGTHGTGVMKIIQFRKLFFRRDLFPLMAICTGWFGSVG